MDNDNKIEKKSRLMHKEVALFLGKEIISTDSNDVKLYNLEAEYAKTKNNKNSLIWKLLCACALVVIVGTISTAVSVKKSNQKIAINIDSFEDLNLRSLLNMVSQAQMQCENARRDKRNLEAERKNELDLAEQKRDNALFTLKSISRISTKSSIERREKNINETYKKSVKEIHAKYDGEIAEINSQIKELEKKLQSFESARLKEARIAESSIDSQKQLYDIEIKKLSEKYEKQIKTLRQELVDQQQKANEEQREAVEEVRATFQAKIDLLDPKAREQSNTQNQIILDAGIKNQLTPSTLWTAVDSLQFNSTDFTNVNSSETFAASIKNTEKELDAMKTIAYRFKPIPMENSIKDYVPAMTRQSYQIATNLAKIGAKMQENISAKDEFLKQFTAQSGFDGIILAEIPSENSATERKFHVYLLDSKSKLFSPDKNEVTAAVFSGSKAVGEITITKDEGYFIAVQKTPQHILQTGDKVRITTQANNQSPLTAQGQKQ